MDLCFGSNDGHHVTYTPAYGLNGTGPGDDAHYTGQLFTEHAVKLIRSHDASKGLFLYFALHNTHAPIEAPARFVAQYKDSGFCDTEQRFNAQAPLLHALPLSCSPAHARCQSTLASSYQILPPQVSFVDESVRNVTTALQKAGLWQDTLFVWTTDNGAPVNSAGSNYPLKGGKGSLWEGGTRTPALVSGGLLPPSMKGRTLDGLVHISDWYASFAELFGVSPEDPHGPTPVTGQSMIGYIFGRQAASPRTEVVHDHLMHCVPDGVQSLAQCVAGQTPDFPGGHYPNHTTGALTQQALDENPDVLPLRGACVRCACRA